MMNTNIEIIRNGRRVRLNRWRLATCLMAFLIFVLCAFMLMYGNTSYPIDVVIKTLGGAEISGASFAIGELRLPRALAGLFAGFAFGIGGNIFQTMLRNPLANPNVIGITTGSAAAAVFCIVVLHSSGAVVSAASVAAGLATVLLLYIIARGKSYSSGTLILVGIGIQAMLSAIVNYLLLRANQQDVPAAMRWLAGSLNGMQMDQLPMLIVPFIIFVPVTLMLSRHLSIMELGEQTASTLGVESDRVRIALIISSVCLISLATAVTGPIAFVSFLAGPIAKRMVGAGLPSNLPAGLCGSALVLSADILGQHAFSSRFPVGVITGLIGAPYLILLLFRMNKKGGL